MENNKYNWKFKQSIVSVYNSGKSSMQICKEYGMSSSTLHKWIRKYTQVKLLCKVLKVARSVWTGCGCIPARPIFYIASGFWVVILTLMQSLGKTSKASVLVLLRQIVIYIQAAFIMLCRELQIRMVEELLLYG